MQMYSAQPVVTIKSASYEERTITYPTFYLDPKVQGIVSVEHAEKIVVDMFNHGNHPNIEVSPNVVLVDMRDHDKDAIADKLRELAEKSVGGPAGDPTYYERNACRVALECVQMLGYVLDDEDLETLACANDDQD